MKTLYEAKKSEKPTRKQKRALKMQNQSIDAGDVKPGRETCYKFNPDYRNVGPSGIVTLSNHDDRQIRQAVNKNPKTAARIENKRRRNQSKNDRLKNQGQQ